MPNKKRVQRKFKLVGTVVSKPQQTLEGGGRLYINRRTLSRLCPSWKLLSGDW
jgi:hypothetical protein